ncbi:murein biosynthesis integral membrane protein MurJ [Chitinimonas sp. JJ19]|uniref:murein biosynthesis integral membrane protein MurJ n=1 Tax=Chitinimonas sp. JJ19 TaxID=3109352 RepID=UPI003001EB92
MNLLKALARTSSMTMLSRILGLAREVMNTHQFGANHAMDAFVVAFKLPNMFRRIFAEGAFSQAFVPILAEYKAQRGEDATREFIADIAGLLTLVLLVFTVLGVIAAPAIVWLSASGFSKDSSQFDLAVQLTRITFPYIFLISLSSLVGSILNTWNRFSIPAFTPTLLNLSMIAFGILLSPHLEEPIFALAIAVAVGGVAQLAFQLPFLARIGMLSRPKLNLGDVGVTRVLKQMVPALFGVSIAQISLLLNTQFASWLQAGSMSWLNYADRLMELPAGVLGVALGTILLPSLARLKTQGQDDDYSAMLDWGLRLCWLLALPATVALAVIAEPLIATLFEHGKFDAHDTAMTQHALSAYAVGLMALISIKVLAPAFYAQQDVKTPMKIGIVTLIVTQLLNLALYRPLGHAGLALSISLAACLNAGLLYAGLRRRNIYTPAAGWFAFLRKLGLAVSLMAALLWWLQTTLGNWHGGSNVLQAGKLALLVGVGALVYFATLAALGFRPRDFSRKAA